MKNKLPVILIMLFFISFLPLACSRHEGLAVPAPSPLSKPDALLSVSPTSTPDDDSYARPEIPRMTCEELKKEVDKGSDFVIVDVRDESKFKKEHIVGAINIPHAIGIVRSQEAVDEKLRALPDSKLKVFYCD